MDFALSEEQDLLQSTVRRFLADRCPTDRVRQIMETETAHDAGLWRGLADLGITAIVVPEADGGLGQDLLDLAVVAEELGYAATPGPFLATSTAAVALAHATDATARAEWLPRVAAGEAIGALAIGEVDEQWDLTKLATRAEGGRLTGTKPLVVSGGVADFTLVAARDGDEPCLWLV